MLHPYRYSANICAGFRRYQGDLSAEAENISLGRLYDLFDHTIHCFKSG